MGERDRPHEHVCKWGLPELSGREGSSEAFLRVPFMLKGERGFGASQSWLQLWLCH